jgi:polysaccharide biosynthesis protein PslH
MKILLLCNKFPYPPRDGGSLATHNMARGLTEAGNMVDLLAMNTSKHYSREGNINIGIRGFNKIREVAVDNSVNYLHLISSLLFSSLPYNAQRFIHKGFSTALREMLRETHYDVIQLEGLYLSPYVQEIRRNSRAKIAYRAHNIEHLIWESYVESTKKICRKVYLRCLKTKIRKFEQGFINQYDLLATFTDADLDKLNSMGNCKPAVVIPFGMYPDEFTEGTHYATNDFHLLYIGALDWLPNIDSLEWFIEKVWVRIKKKHPGLRFKVAGRNAKAGLAAKIRREGIDFIGEVASSKDYLSQDGIVIVPLFSGSGIRVKIIEAFFMRKPVIATTFAVSGIPVEDGVNILLSDNAEEFIDNIERLLTDRNYAASLGLRAGELSSGFFNNKLLTGELSAFYKNHAV